MAALTGTIIEKVKRLITLPPDETLFKTADYIEFINECLLEEIYPNLMKVRDDYCLIRQVFPLSNAQNQNLYPTGIMPIPNRAWGNTLRELRYIDNCGNLYKMNEYFLSDLDLYQTKNMASTWTWRRGYVAFNSGIQLVPPPLNDPGSVEMHYILSPSEVVDSAFYFAAIDDMSYNTSTQVATFTVPDLNNGSGVDGYCNQNQTALFDIYNYKTGMFLYIDLPMTRIGDTTFTCNVIAQDGTNLLYPNITELNNFQLGGFPVDTNTYVQQLYLVPSGASSFTPIPDVLDRVLVYEVAMKILSAQGYVEELQIFVQKHEQLKKSLYSQMAKRVDAESKVIKNKRGLLPSVMSGGGYRRYNR
jgi:hypothetical protein